MNFKITKVLIQAGLPLFWQLYSLGLVFLIFINFFIQNPTFTSSINIVTSVLIFIGVTAGFKLKQKDINPWAIFLLAIGAIQLSTITKSFLGLGFINSSYIGILLEELGIALIAIFSLNIMLKFERQYRLNGFVIDFSLVLISSFCLILFISPNIFNDIISDTNIEKRILFAHLILGIVLISVILVSQDLLNQIRIKDIILGLMITALSSHFILDYSMIYQKTESIFWLDSSSNMLYALSGALAILHIFTEDYDLDFDLKSSKKLGKKFVWSASVFALLVLPFGVLLRWKMGYPMIDQTFIALTSAFLSIIVIWRIILLLKNYEKQRKTIKDIAFKDPLTGLPNYLNFKNDVRPQKNLLVFCLNIEDFKSINDLYNRQFGDEVLASLGKRLKDTPNILYTARISGDNFMAVFKCKSSQLIHQYRALSKHLGVWDTITEHRVAVPLTYGASHSKETIEPEVLARQAESALKTARSKHLEFALYKHSTIDAYKPETTNLKRHELREILQNAIDNNHLPVHFQPIYDINSGTLKALEMLIRVQTENNGLLHPAQFLDQAKSYGMLTNLTKVCINMVSQNIAKLPDVTININVPPYMLNDSKILNEFIDHFYAEGLSTKRICLEVTEDGEIPTEHLIPAIEILKAHGFSISMDDFGTGYSSLGRLSILPVDSVKIDRSLLLTANNGDKTILESAINLVKRLGVNAVVEGVETIEQLNLVKELGADSVQGFLFAKPEALKKKNQFMLNTSDIIAEY